VTTHGAAPEGHLAATSGGRINTGNAASIALPNLPLHVLHLLHEEGVRDLHDWRRLGRRRLRIFGITSKVVAQIDAAAREARE
jgi:hypothetical protein